MVSGHAILAETCTPPFICSQCFLSAYIPVPARDTWSTWRRAWWVAWWVDMIALQKPVSQKFRYLQPVPPVGLLTGFSNGCNFYWSTWRRSLEIKLFYGEWTCYPCRNLYSSLYLQPALPVGLYPGCNFKGVRGEGAWRKSGHAWWVDMIAMQKPVSHPVICSHCLLLAYWPVSARGAISTWSTWRRSLEIVLSCGEWTW